MGSLTKSQTFSPDWLELGFIRANREKHDSQEPGVVLHSFYVQILPIYLISSLNLKVQSNSNFHPLFA